MYFWNYVDRGALAQARLNSLESDLGMVDDNFNTAVSILTIGYVLMQIPSNMLITRVRPNIYLASCALIWSILSGVVFPTFQLPELVLTCRVACNGFVTSYGSLLACRFLLGFFEAPVSSVHPTQHPRANKTTPVLSRRTVPSIDVLQAQRSVRQSPRVPLRSTWLTPATEVASRIALFYSAQMVGLSFANLIAAGVFSGMDGLRGLAGWRWYGLERLEMLPLLPC